MPGPHQVVGAGLARRIGRIGLIGRAFVERAGRSKRAVDLVGRDVMETELRLVSAQCSESSRAPRIELVPLIICTARRMPRTSARAAASCSAERTDGV